MKILKAWFFACLAFGFYSLETFIEESYEENYEFTSGTEPDQFQYLVCEKLTSVYPKKTEIDLRKIRGGEDLFKYFNNSFNYDRKLKETTLEQLEYFWNLTQYKDYLIFNEMVCLLATRMEMQKIGYFLFEPPPAYFAIHMKTFDFIKLNYISNKIDQLTVVKSAYSNCDQSNGRYHCLNKCFKKFRLSKYFYGSSETGTIRLHDNDRNQTVSENEKYCAKK